MANEVFISYSRSDYQKVRKIKETIDQKVGIDCWMDLEGIESDQQFVDVIINAINKHDTVLFMMSEASMHMDKAEMPDKFYFLYHGKDQIEWINVGQRRKLIKNLRSWCQPDEDDRPARLSTFAIPEGARGATVMIDLGDSKTESIYSYKGGETKKVSEKTISTIPEVDDGYEPAAPSGSPFTPPKKPQFEEVQTKGSIIKQIVSSLKSFLFLYYPIIISSVIAIVIFFFFFPDSCYNEDNTNKEPPAQDVTTEVQDYVDVDSNSQKYSEADSISDADAANNRAIDIISKTRKE